MNNAPPSRSTLVAAFASIYLIWGSTFLAIRFAVETIPPFIMAGLRFSIAGAVLYAWMWARGAPRPTARHWRSAAIVGCLLLVGGNGMVSWAEKTVPSGLASLVIAAVPMWMVLMDWGFNGVRPHPVVIGGVALGFLGIVFLISPGDAPAGAAPHLGGTIALIAATVSWAAGSLYSRKAPLPDSPFVTTAMEMLAAGAVLFVLALVSGEGTAFDASAIDARSLLSLAYLIGAGSLVAFTSYVWLLRETTPARASTYAYVNPVVAVLLGWLFADEVLTGRMVVAAATIIVGVAVIIAYRDRRPPVGRNAEAS